MLKEMTGTARKLTMPGDVSGSTNAKGQLGAMFASLVPASELQPRLRLWEMAAIGDYLQQRWWTKV